MYRKLMVLLMAVAVLGLAIGLVGCPKKAAPPTTGGGGIPVDTGPSARPAPERSPAPLARPDMPTKAEEEASAGG